MNKVIFLDRDGTINFDCGYVYEIEKFKFLDGVTEGLKELQNLGFKLIIITNQSGIERGYFKESDYLKLNNYMLKELSKSGVEIAKVYHCPHFFTQCECRKPKLELFYRAAKDFNVDFSKSYAIGDKIRDLSICSSEMVKGILISNESVKTENITVVNNFNEAVSFIKKQ